MRGLPGTLCLVMSAAVGRAAEPPVALELVFHDAVRYQPMDVKSAAAHQKDPSSPLALAVGKDGKPTPVAVQPLHVYLALAQPAGTVTRARAAQDMINNALNMPGMGPNAPRGCLNASWREGRTVTAHLGDTYGYNLWLATVDAGGLVLRDGKLTGKLIGHVTSTYQDKYAGECVWTIDAAVVGRRVLGAGTGKKSGGKGRTEDFVHAGTLDPKLPAAQLDARMDDVGACHAAVQRARAAPKDAANRAELEAAVARAEAKLSKGTIAQIPGVPTSGYGNGGIYLICMTPCSDGERVAAVFPTGIAVAYDLQGERLWSADVRPPVTPPKEYGKSKWRAVPPNLSTCPVFPQEGIVVVVWGPMTSGLDAATGQVLWRAYGECSHCSPVVGRVGGESCVARGDYDILRVRDGLKVHDDPRPASHNCSVSPVFADGVFHWVTHAVQVIPGDPPRAQALWEWDVERLKAMARGDKNEGGYPYSGPVPHLHNVDFTSPVVMDGKLLYYGWGVMSVIDAATGAKVAQPRLPKSPVKPLSGGVTKNWAYGGMIRAGERLILVHDNGLVKIFSINDTFAPMQACALPEDCYAQPVCDASALFVRTLGTLYCFEKGPR